MNKLTYRSGQFFLFLLSLLILLGSLYFQYVEELTPCPLCLMQRLCTFILALLCFIAWLKFSTKTKILTIFQFLFCLLGAYFAARQLWLMSLPPDESGTCLPGFSTMLHYLPWKDTLHALVFGSTDCSINQWSWLGLSMPAWSLLFFLFVFAAVFLLRGRHFKERQS